ncbi:MAG: type II toxin-antitoxin system HicB family antitoxin [bacterium]
MVNQYINVTNAENVVLIKASLDAFITQEESKVYVSCCPAFDLYSQGETKKEARDNIIEATELLFETCIEDQTLDQMLANYGFHPAKKRRTKKVEAPPEFKDSEPFKIPVELPMMAYG